MSHRDRQLGENEAIFRDVNETVAAAAEPRLEPVLFLCECADDFCAESLALTLAEYEDVRTSPTRFLVKPGHAKPEIEVVVERRRTFWVVDKFGEAAEVARAANGNGNGHH